MRCLLVIAGVFAAACTNTALPEGSQAPRACSAEGMWCQDAQHSRCCRGLKCEDSRCVRTESKQDRKERDEP